jgi:hypothetical protein
VASLPGRGDGRRVESRVTAPTASHFWSLLPKMDGHADSFGTGVLRTFSLPTIRIRGAYPLRFFIEQFPATCSDRRHSLL